MQYNSNILNSTYQRENQEIKPQRKKFEDLTLMDSFLFDAATEKPENAAIIAKVIIERTTKRKVKKLVVETQKELKGININKHGIRMDVYTTEINESTNGDEITCVYDIEPNNYEDKDVARRNRFYQSLIDSKLLPSDTPYSSLPDMISIWILPYDPFDDNRMVYTVKNIVTENNQLVYNDGVTKIFLYTKGTKGGSKELKELLTFLENPIYDNAMDEELLQILNIVDSIKGNSKERGRYMGLMGYLDYEIRDARKAAFDEGHAEGLAVGHAEGLAEGHAEGLIEGQIQGSINTCKFMKVERNVAKAAIIEQFAISEEVAEKYLNKYWNE